MPAGKENEMKPMRDHVEEMKVGEGLGILLGIMAKKIDEFEARVDKIDKSLWSLNFERVNAAIKKCGIEELKDNKPHEYKLGDDVEVKRGEERWKKAIYINHRFYHGVYISEENDIYYVNTRDIRPLKESK